MAGKHCKLPVWSLLILVPSLTACVPDQADAPLFLPPTNPVQERVVATLLSPQSQATPMTPQIILPTPTLQCNASLSFLEDLTIPDGMVVQPGDRLDKRWLVENSGTCNWDRNYGLILISGPRMGAPREQALYPARSGSTAVIRILFTTPDEPGVYRSAWQARDPHGEVFGDPFFIEIVVSRP